jgi:hypothetical protein
VTPADPLAMTSALREAIRGIDPNLPMMGVKTQEQQVDEALTAERMFAKISSFFGLLALFLVIVGLYGTLAYAVVRRTGEIGIRMTFCARHPSVVDSATQISDRGDRRLGRRAAGRFGSDPLHHEHALRRESI